MTPACFATTDNCSIAAGRRTSVDTSSGCRPCFASHRPSLPDVVVLPGTLQAKKKDDPRSLRGRGKTTCGIAEEPEHLVADDADDLLGRCQALEDVLVDRAIAHPIDESLDDLEVDVRLEQRHSNLAQREFDRLLGEADLAPQRAEHILETVAE